MRAPHSYSNDFVSIVVPAFNAESTIRETVGCALDQSHSNIEVIVVDDGSVDGTKEVVRSLIDRDPRVRYFHKTNGGVASARNLGIANSRGDFVATLDADDLWYPTKLQRQLERFHAASPKTALVYTWCCWIDDAGVVTGYSPPTHLEGNILRQMCLGNVIISGSNALIRREALIAAKGFDETLRSRGGQGCEDWKLYLQIAKGHEIAVAPEYLVGYRVSPGSMSDDFDQMMRSHRLVEMDFLHENPALSAELAHSEIILARSLAVRAIEQGQFRGALWLLIGSTQNRTASALASATWLLGGLFRRLWRRVTAGPPHQHGRFLPPSSR